MMVGLRRQDALCRSKLLSVLIRLPVGWAMYGLLACWETIGIYTFAFLSDFFIMLFVSFPGVYDGS